MLQLFLREVLLVLLVVLGWLLLLLGVGLELVLVQVEHPMEPSYSLLAWHLIVAWHLKLLMLVWLSPPLLVLVFKNQ